MNSQTKVSDQERYCLTCAALNSGMSLNEGEGFQYIHIQAHQEEAIRSFVILLNRWLNRIRCTVCVQRDTKVNSIYWLSFRFFELDRMMICSILQQESFNAGLYGDWPNYLATSLLNEQPN